MAKVSFDGATKIISVTQAPVDGLVELSVKEDLYSDWKEWVLADDNSKYEQALRVVGGDAVSSTQSLGATFFLMNGWRIRPYEASHRLRLSGNLYTDPAGFSPVVSTLGAYAVVIEYAVSNLVDAVNSAQEGAIRHSLFGDQVSVDVASPYSGTLFPTGTPQKPVNNFADALVIAEAQGLTRLRIYGYAYLNSGLDYRTMEICGQGPLITQLEIASAAQVDDCVFRDARIYGVLDSHAWCENCEIGNLSYVEGRLINCAIEGTLTIAGDGALLVDCYSSRLSSDNIGIIDLGGAHNVAIHNYSGHLQLQNMTGGTCGLSFNRGHLTIDATVTGGMTHVMGDVKITDNHTGDADIRLRYVTSPDQIAKHVWERALPASPVAGSFEEALANLSHEAFGRWTLDFDNDVLTLYKADGITVLKTFSLTRTEEIPPAYIQRTPQ